MVHDHEIWVWVIIIHSVDVGVQKSVIELVVASLSETELLESTANLEEILDDVL